MHPNTVASQPARARALFALALTCTLVGTSCSSAYYKAWDLVGWQKRDLLVDFVQQGRNDQTEAKEQIQETYKSFQELTGKDGGELEVVYKRLSKDLTRSKDAAAHVSKSIRNIEDTANAMFTEWQKELAEIETPELRARSEVLLGDTKLRYGKMLGDARRRVVDETDLAQVRRPRRLPQAQPERQVHRRSPNDGGPHRHRRLPLDRRHGVVDPRSKQVHRLDGEGRRRFELSAAG
ncbi:MAG TPA: DUF2959 family protein [Planctomycetota bacterium]|nr:DUF2959 family protein [Planctomycetota bacterium]